MELPFFCLIDLVIVCTTLCRTKPKCLSIVNVFSIKHFGEKKAAFMNVVKLVLTVVLFYKSVNHKCLIYDFFLHKKIRVENLNINGNSSFTFLFWSKTRIMASIQALLKQIF